MDNIRKLIREVCSRWGDIQIDRCAKYLGFHIGPGSEEKSWIKPLQKYSQRVLLWSAMQLGLCLNIVAYRIFIASVLTFVMQLEPLSPTTWEAFESSLRRLAPGPGSWATVADLCNLETECHFKGEFPDPRWTALAAKLRVINTLAKDAKRFRDELLHLQVENGRRPFPAWHRRCLFGLLASAEAELAEEGITQQEVAKRLRVVPRSASVSFQRCAEQMIRKTYAPEYFRDARLRSKCFQWKFEVLAGHLERRVVEGCSCSVPFVLRGSMLYTSGPYGTAGSPTTR